MTRPSGGVSPGRKNPPLVLLTHSRTRALRRCPQYHFLRYEAGIAPVQKREGGNALNIGSAFHECLEIIQGEVDEVAQDQKIRGHLREFVVADRLDLTEAVIVQEMARGWRERWEGPGYTPVAVEVPFSLMIEGTRGYRDAGKIDAIGEVGGRLCLVEHKTTARDIDASSDYWLPLRFDTQLSRYFNAARALGYEVTDILYDVARKPGIRPRKLTKGEIEDIIEGQRYAGEMIESDAELVRVRDARDSSIAKWPKKVPVIRESAYLFSLRLREEIRSKPDRYFQRVRIPRMQADLDDHAASVVGDVALHRHMKKAGHWPRNDAACFDFSTACRYLEFCANRIDPSGELPPGFERLENIHPELES